MLRKPMSLIRNFGREQFGGPLFVPDVLVETTPWAETQP